jgi:hypothetical protein
MAERDRPYSNFREWLLDQVERHDPIGDLARDFAEDEDTLKREDIVGRTESLDSLLLAGREWDAVRQHESSLEDLRRLQRLLYHLFERLHAETDCGRDGKHWAECDTIAFAFGWKSWDEWKHIGGLFDD